ncbi:MAG: ATP-binding protein [Candidatus Peribacteraceae bacterium]|nr:ATP-binding protein [Candidatus Peribacteraceae bacterium]
MKIIFMIGLPGSGKTTYVNKYLNQGFQIICPDDVRASLGSPHNPRHEPVVMQVCDVMARAHLERGVNVIVDATNLSWKLLAKYVNTSKHEYNYETMAVVLNVSEKVCRERRADRLKDDVYHIRFAGWVSKWKEISTENFAVLKHMFDEVIIIGGD